MILSDIYKAILARVTTIPEVKYFGYYAGEYDNEEDLNEAINFPAVHMEYAPLDTTTLGSKRQQADALVILTIASQVPQPIDNRQSDNVRNGGLAHLALIDTIHAKLQGWGGAGLDPAVNFGSMDRIGITPWEGRFQLDNSFLVIHSVAYKTRIVDDAALVTYQLMDPQPTLNGMLSWYADDAVGLQWEDIGCELNTNLTDAQKLKLLPKREVNNMDAGLVSIHAEDAINRLTGNELDFFTLPCNNFVGLSAEDAAAAGITLSTARFTNSKGGSVFDGSDGSIPGYVLDHFQKVWDGTRNCLALSLDLATYSPAPVLLPQALTDCAALTLNSFSDWFLPNMTQAFNLGYNQGVVNGPPLNYPPFNLTDSAYWTSTPAGSNRAFRLEANGGVARTVYTSNSSKWIAARKHTY